MRDIYSYDYSEMSSTNQEFFEKIKIKSCAET